MKIIQLIKVIMEKLAERRIAEYRTLIDDFQTEIRNIKPKGIQEPHIPVFGDYYEKCKYKLVFCGMETLGWGDLKDFLEKDPVSLVTASDYTINDLEYIGWKRNDHATFWGFVLKFLAKFYNADLSDLVDKKYPNILKSFIWANANSVERFEVSAANKGAEFAAWQKVKKASLKLDDINHIINVANPQVIFIVYKDAKEDFFLNDSTLTSAFELDNNNRKKYLRIDDLEYRYSYYYRRDSNTHIFHLPHPRYMGIYSGIGIDKYIESIISKIQQYHIFESLPHTPEDCCLSEIETTIDKSSIVYKRNFIANLAEFLVKNNSRMAGNELREIFNRNRIYTSYGTPYAEGSYGNRGIHKVLSSVYNYYQSLGDYQTAYNISRAFVNQNDEYAY